MSDDRPPAGSPAAERESKAVAGAETIAQIKAEAAKAKAEQEEERHRGDHDPYRERREMERMYQRMVL